MSRLPVRHAANFQQASYRKAKQRVTDQALNILKFSNAYKLRLVRCQASIAESQGLNARVVNTRSVTKYPC